MAKRFTDTELWDKDWFMKLKPRLKCLTKFIFDKCDVAGVWSPNWILASAYIGEPVKESDLKEIDSQIEKMPDGRFFIPGFISFQYGTLSENCKPHVKIISLLKKYGLYEKVLIGYSKGIDTQQEKEKEADKEQDEEMETEKEKELPEKKLKPELVFPYVSEEFMKVWQVLVKEKKWRNKSVNALQAALKKLSGYCETDAIKMMNNTIVGEWQGIFELDEKSKNGITDNKKPWGNTLDHIAEHLRQQSTNSPQKPT